MNDRFKFRFWDKETKTMQKIPMVELRHRISLDKIFADDRVIFMQYTGLKDKNSKLIYEGDIVKYDLYNCHSNNPLTTAIVKYDNKFARFVVECLEFYLKRTFEEIDYCEVIGNIYENKSLLESEG